MTSGKILGLLSIILLIVLLCLLPSNCKKKPTTPELPPLPPSDNAIFISCNPVSGGTGTNVNLTITINGNHQDIEAFGMDLTFDHSIFQYLDMERGSLTGDWAEVNGNVTTPGLLVVGGFKGAGTTIQTNSLGDLAVIKFKVIYAGAEDNITQEISIKNYKDNIAGMIPEPTSTTFTFKK
jgi:hypothetical protein